MSNKVLTISLVITIVFFILHITSGWGSNKDKDDNPVLLIGDPDSTVSQKGLNMFYEQRAKWVKTLCEILDQRNIDKYSRMSRYRAAFALALLRAPEAVPLLLPCIEEFRDLRGLPKDLRSHSQNPAVAAIIEIGLPAIPHLIEDIKRQPDKLVRSHRAGLIDAILCQRIYTGKFWFEGGKKEWAISLLERESAQEKPGPAKQNLDKVIKELKELWKESLGK